MPVSRTYHDYVIDQMRKISAVSSRAMFGGYAIYSNGVAFAILDDDHLYFKTGDSNRADYVSAGMQPWDPYGDGRVSFSNFEVPESVLEDPAELADWAQKAIAVAIAKKKKPAVKTAAAKRSKKTKAAPKKTLQKKKTSDAVKKKQPLKKRSR